MSSTVKKELGGGVSVEMDKIDFQNKQDMNEDRRNDGTHYAGLMTTEEYANRRKALQTSADVDTDKLRKEARKLVDLDRAAGERAAKERQEREKKKKEALLSSMVAVDKKDKEPAENAGDKEGEAGPPKKKAKKDAKRPKQTLSFDVEEEDG
eukprot:jgi/Mesvir1/4725/Mv11593-RA.1